MIAVIRKLIGRPATLVRARVLVVCTILVEAAAGWLLVSVPPETTEFVAALALHGGASALFGWALVGPYSVPARPHTRSWALLGSVVSLVAFPLFGMIGTLVGFAAARHLARRARRVRGLGGRVSGAEETTRLLARAESRRVDLFEDLEIEPIVDVLREPDLDLKRGAIDALVRSDRRHAIRVLQELIRDPNAEVRLYSSITLSKLEDDIGKAILAARAAVADAPVDAWPRRHLATLYVDYAESGLLDDVTRGYYLRLAVRELETARGLQPEDADLTFSLGRVHLLRGEPDLASPLLARAIELEPEHLDAHMASMELSYGFGAFDELSAQAAAALRVIPAEHPQRSLVEWWARPVPSGV